MSHHTATYIRPGHIPGTGAITPTRAMPAVIAHRGADADAPQNTLAALNLAWQQGADGIDEDFHLTWDGEGVWLKHGLCSEAGPPGLLNQAPQAFNRPSGCSR